MVRQSLVELHVEQIRMFLTHPAKNNTFLFNLRCMWEVMMVCGIYNSQSQTSSESSSSSLVNISHCSALTDSPTSALSSLKHLLLFCPHFPPHHTKCMQVHLQKDTTSLGPMNHYWLTLGNACVCLITLQVKHGPRTSNICSASPTGLCSTW